eukprot:TRINITY_DN21908_c0_g1_i1.p1 TRINITY_DN21908_c0_g1~~TRINITY_DN21908_c0_g1_i1.p1  ORF type:complete len:200 (+),score=71.55 TRINITY_DN21908_c0_g1_i1:86-601(+)
MGDDEDQEAQGEDEFPHLIRVASDEQYAELVQHPDLLTCSVFVSAKCDICKMFVPEVGAETKKQEEYQRPFWPAGGAAVQFLLVDVDTCPEAVKRAGLCAVPTTTFSLAGQPFGRNEHEMGFSGSSVDKFQKMLRNCYGSRNEKLKDADTERRKADEAAKKAAEAAATEEE